jgi:hypothetical protein
MAKLSLSCDYGCKDQNCKKSRRKSALALFAGSSEFYLVFRSEENVHAHQTGSCFPIITIIKWFHDFKDVNHCVDCSDDRLLITGARAHFIVHAYKGP